MASSYHAKVTSTQNKGVPLFSCLGHGVYYYIFLFGKSQSFSDSSYLIMLIDVQRLHENGKQILSVSNEAKWLSVRLRKATAQFIDPEKPVRGMMNNFIHFIHLCMNLSNNFEMIPAVVT